jgi:3',5'-cyclic AMP phosphodiesterase CpdA
MRTIHLSDLHFSHDDVSQHNFLRGPLTDSLRRLKDEIGSIDSVIVSGDLVNNPDEADVYLRLLDFLDEVSTAVSAPIETFVFCPGNHDVSRRALEEHSTFRGGLIPHLDDQNYLCNLYQKGRLSAYATAIQASFFAFCDLLGHPWEDPFYCLRTVGEVQCLCLNTAFYCSYTGSKEDRGQLWVPATTVDSALARASDAPLYAICHHPLSELRDSCERVVKPILSRASRCIFFGHVHDAIPVHEVQPGSQCLYLQSGALYEKTDYFRGYSIYSTLQHSGAQKVE